MLAPVAYKPVKKLRHLTVAQDPFSKERKLNLPNLTAPPVRNRETKTTRFINISRRDDGYKVTYNVVYKFKILLVFMLYSFLKSLSFCAVRVL